MRTLSILLALLAAPAVAAPILLTPIPADRAATTVNSVIGSWTADGVNQPIGWSVAAKPLLDASTPDLTWSLGNLTTSTTYVASGTYFITFSDWAALAQGSAPAGYKQVQAGILNPPWGTPSAGDTIVIELRTADSSPGWEVLASPSFTAQAAAVPEPTTLAMLVAGGLAAAFWRTRRGR